MSVSVCACVCACWGRGDVNSSPYVCQEIMSQKTDKFCAQASYQICNNDPLLGQPPANQYKIFMHMTHTALGIE